MNAGTALLGIALVSGTGTTVALLLDYLRGTDRYVRYAEWGIATTSLALVVSLTYLTYQFVVTDYTNAYVWQNTADYLPLLYRVTGVYAANEGSILLWAAIASVISLWVASTRGFDDRSTKLVQAVVVGFVTYLAGLLFDQSPFASVWSAVDDIPAGVTPQTGSGLNALLVDPFMAIHPPVMFVSYALLTMPFAIGVTHFVSALRGEGGIYDAWEGSIIRWLRVSWLFLTTAVALGAFWSYTVLGWGGLWAWDPVETAILIPWLFLTGTLHAVTNYQPGRRYTILAPAMTATTLAQVVYTTSVVRSNVFRSVHSFTSGGIGFSLLVLMVLTVGLAVGLPFVYWLRVQDDESDNSNIPPFSRSTLLHAAVLLFGLLTFISLWGLTFPLLRNATTGIEVAVEPRYYNLWSFPVVIATLLLLGLYMDFDVEGKRRSLVAFGITVVATLVGAAIAPSSAWQLGTARSGDALIYQLMTQVSALAIVPPVAYVLITVTKRGYARFTRATNSDARRKEVGVTLVHVSVAVLLFSLPFTYMLASQASVIAGAAGGTAGSTVDVPDSDYSLRVLDQQQRELPQNPDPSTYAQSSSEVLARGEAVNETVLTVHGTVTNVRNGNRATVVQLDNSGLWLGVTGENVSSFSPQEGQTLVARGVVMQNYVPQTDAVVLTGPTNVGTPANPPASVDPARVRVTTVDLAVYRDSQQVVTGTAGQREYLKQSGMEVRDVIIDRGPIVDTYVIAGVSDGQASITVKRIPFMTPIRVSVVTLLVGMSLILAYDPQYGIATTSRRDETASRTDLEPTTSE
ncbi:cytochrome c-type biogenesis protein CcmF [Halogranum amylolyticum]|uniref:Cytochrome c-type biogenesis protein CcmF n=1 Tax=Halogranum amylolyticum TaxID=660520 RepID=A0A1H8NKB0_9EURY|nr:cytochrome c biogenesis protein CcsA [Halogranum amylolyticum]SEO30054.1 cytochrome c-type biogenesis protein CcmF [Halogranum amylolyticum]